MQSGWKFELVLSLSAQIQINIFPACSDPASVLTARRNECKHAAKDENVFLNDSPGGKKVSAAD